ncbi:beta strand repeat-containing protein [Azomonas macrocytogenes]|nr:Ig-like domain-containing protein [Azomonas macrocytogenes]
MIYDIVVTLPEGTTHDLRVDGLVPNGLKLDTTYNGDLGYEFITIKGTGAGQSDALEANFDGTVEVTGVTGVSGTLGNSSVDPRFTLTDNLLIADDGNNASDNNFVIRVRLIADNIIFNQAGGNRDTGTQLIYDDAGDNGADVTVAQTGASARITIREPQLTIVKAVDTNGDNNFDSSEPAVDDNDPIKYRITIGNGNTANDYDAFDLRFEDTFASVLDVDTESLVVTKNGSPIVAADYFEWVGNKLQTKDGVNLDLLKGETLVIEVSAVTRPEVAAVASFDSNAIVHWSSLDSASNATGDRIANERHGDDGTWNQTGILNDYRKQDGALVSVAANYVLSRVGGLADTTVPGDDTTADNQPVAVGEIVRFRAVVQVPEGNISGLVIQPNLASGYTYLGAATVALVSDGGLTSNIVTAPVADTSTGVFDDIESGLNSSNFGSRPIGSAPTQAITIVAAAGGNPAYFDLGNIANLDNDPEAEYIVIEFNALVTNSAGNNGGTELESNFIVKQNGIGGTQLGTDSNTTVDIVAEPNIPSIDKQVFASADGAGAPNQAATDTLTVRTTFIAATGTATSPAAPAYDAVLTDSLTNGSGYTFKSLTADGTTYTTQAAAEAAGYTFTFDDGTGVTVNFNGNAINPGETVTFEYDVTVPTDTVGTPTDATLVWSSLPDGAGTISQTGFAGSSVGTDGTTGGERIWDSATALLNDYRRQDNAGYSTISGNIWDDTRDQNGAKDAGEQALAGVTVTLTTAGADGLWGTSDDVVVATTQTESNGDYIFGALPVGDYRVTAPATLDATITGTPDDTDTLAPRWDADGGTLGSITVTLGTMATTGRNIGYLQENDAPTVTFADTTPRTFVEGVDTLTDRDVLGTPVALGTVTVADVEIANGLDTYENTTLTIARSNGTTGFTANAEDVLGFTGSGDTGINVSGGNLRNGTTVIGTVTNSGGQLVITFNAAADASIVNAVASAITYANSSDTPPADVTLRYRFNDANDNSKQGSGGALTGDAIIQVNITAQNDPPLAIDDTNEVVEDSLVPATGNVITGVSTTVTVPDTVADSDVDNTIDELNLSGIRTGTEIAGGAFTSITAGTNSGTGTQVVGTYGTLTIGADGSYSYELDNDNPDVNALLTGETLEEVFTYRLTDPDGGTDQAQLTITIHGVTDGGNLAIDPVDHNGGAAIGHNTVYEAGLTSAADTSETAAGSIIVSAPEGIATITVEGEDFTVAELQALSTTNPSDPIDTGEGILRITGITVLAGDSSVPTSTQVHYTYTLKDAITNATPAETESTDSISLRVTDNSTSANTADGTLVIQIIDDVPAANPDASSITKGSATVTGNAFTNDRIGADGAATVGSPVTAIAGGTLGTPYNGTYGAITLNANGSYTYTLDNNNTAVQALGHGQTLTETFTYTITDGDGDTSTATVTITIHGDHLPLALNDSFTLNEDTVLTSTLAGNDTPSADGGNLWAKATDPQHGSVVVNPDGTFTYTPAPDYNGPDSFTYTLTDGDGDTSTATVNLTVTPVNDLPVAVDDSVTTGKNTPVGGTLAGNDTPSGDGGNLWTKTTDPANGSVVVNPDGTYAYTPDEGFSGEDSFTYTITDADGDTSTATVTITVSPTDVPLAVDDTVTTPGGTPVSGSLAGNDTPSTDGGNTWTLTDSPTNGTVVVNEDGTFTYTPNEGFVGEDSFTYTITDADGDTSTATVTITVSPTDVPLAVDDTVTTPGGTPVSGNLAGNDTPSTDGGNTWTLTDSPTNGTVAVNEDGTFTYTPDEGFVGEDSFTYTLTDADGDSSTATVTITVNPPVTEPEPVNTPPVAVNDGVFTAPADTPLTNLDVLGNDSDPDGDPLTVTGASVPPGQGTVTINPDGTLDFTPAPDYTGPVEITYTIDDGNGGTATAVVNIEVVTTPTPPSSIPLAVNDHVTTGADTPISSSLAGNDTPSGNGDNTWALEIGPLHGSVVVNADGTFTYMPNARFEGRDSFTYTLTDAVGSVSQATVTIVLVDPVSPYVFSPATGAQPLPPLELWPTNLLQERENHDPSVFFDGGRFDRVIRLPIPMYPITYVNNAVELSQLQRGLTDPLLFSRPERADTLRLERSSANQELGFDPALFVQHQVRESQSLANFLQQIVEGRLTRVSLGSDRLIATPELSAPSPAELIPPTHEKAAKSVEKPDHEHRDTGSTPLLRESAATDGNELLPKAQTRPSAPSFTQQLRSATGRGAKLPASVGGSNGFV